MSKTVLGIELGSTRIKAVAVDESFRPVSNGDYTWASSLENGVWTYHMDQVWTGLKAAVAGVQNRESIAAMGVSAMMHGYLAFDRDWNLLVPFRTWQNTITGPAADALTAALNFNSPPRWSISHLYQAVLNGEAHLSRLAHITTLAGYVHHCLTGQNVLGVGEASGMFPIDSTALDYDQGMVEKCNALLREKGYDWDLRDLLPTVLPAGAAAGVLTAEGAALLDGLLAEGIPFAPPEGDAGTGMVATNSVAPRTGNVSAGTSIFGMVVLEKPLSRVYPEIDLVTTPSGAPVAMVHCNNCTNDMNAWVGVLRETAALFGAQPDTGAVYTALYNKSLEGDADCGGVQVCNYLAGEGVTHFDSGMPLVAHTPGKPFTLANFVRAQLYSTVATLAIGMELLTGEQVVIDRLMGHGGLFKTPVVGQKYLAAACNAPVTCMETAGEGGPYGMALLAAYLLDAESGRSLERFLDEAVFAGAAGTTLQPDAEDVQGFARWLKGYRGLLAAERAAVETM